MTIKLTLIYERAVPVANDNLADIKTKPTRPSLPPIAVKRKVSYRPHRVHLEQPLSSGETRTVGDVVLNTYTTPLDFAITNDFLNSLSAQENTILEDLSAGYTAKEIKERNHFNNSRLKSLRKDLASKAVEYLM